MAAIRNKRLKNTLDEYIEGILSGEIPSSEWVRLAANRHVNDLERNDLLFDWKPLIEFNQFMRTLPLVEDHTGKPFKMLPWQVFCAASILCWKYKEDKSKRFKTSLLQIGRGAGKTTFAAGLCLFHIGKIRDRECLLLANSAPQAAIALRKAKSMVYQLGLRQNVEATDSHTWVEDFDGHGTKIRARTYDINTCKNSILKVLPSVEARLDGYSPNFAVVDECFSASTRAMCKLWTAQTKRDTGAHILHIGTPGNKVSPAYELRDMLCRELQGDEVTGGDQIWGALYEANPDEPEKFGTDESFIQANPGAIHGRPTLKALKQHYDSSQASELSKREFYRDCLCVQLEGDTNWVSLESFDKCAKTSLKIEDLIDYPCCFGLDLSRTFDSSSLSIAFSLPDKVAIWNWSWVCIERAEELEQAKRCPVRRWIVDKTLLAFDGRAIRHDIIIEKTKELARKLDCRCIGFDPYAAQRLAQELEAEGLPARGVRQGVLTMSPMLEEFQNLIESGKLVHNGNEFLRHNIASARVRPDSSGNVKILRNAGNSPGAMPGFTDAAVSATIAIGLLFEEVEKNSVYEDTGLTIL